MDYPFLNAGALSDDELMRRIQKCNRILATEMSMGHSAIVQSAMSQLETYQFEWNERMQSRARKEFFDKNPEANKPIEIGTISEEYFPDDKEDEDKKDS